MEKYKEIPWHILIHGDEEFQKDHSALRAKHFREATFIEKAAFDNAMSCLRTLQQIAKANGQITYKDFKTTIGEFEISEQDL